MCRIRAVGEGGRLILKKASSNQSTCDKGEKNDRAGFATTRTFFGKKGPHFVEGLYGIRMEPGEESGQCSSIAELEGLIEAKKKRLHATNASLAQVPASFPASFATLKEVSLAGNVLTRLSPAMSALEACKILDLSKNRLQSVERDHLPPKLAELCLSENEPLVEICSLPESLHLLVLRHVPNVGYPPRSVLALPEKKPQLKGRKLKAVKAWLAKQTEPTYRLPLENGRHIDFSIGITEDKVVATKPMEDRSSYYCHPLESAASSGNDNADSAQFQKVKLVHSMVLCVFDGHLGSFVAEYAKEHLITRLQDAGLFSGNIKGEQVAALMNKVIEAFDEEILNETSRQKISDGATCSIAHVGNDGVVTSCWLGDSRMIMGHTNGWATPLSEDHKPDNDVEKEYIEKLGGEVSTLGCARVNGVLAMSRSLGDRKLKRPTPFVRAEPSNIQRPLDLEKDATLILASDGLWDVCSNELAARTAVEVDGAYEASKKLVRIAKLNGTRDNTCVMVVRIDVKQDLK